jgi:hypothetical protein
MRRPPAVTLAIDTLVLEGFAARDGVPLAWALAAELARLIELGALDVAGLAPVPGPAPVRDAGRVPRGDPGRPDLTGRAVAGAVLGALA